SAPSAFRPQQNACPSATTQVCRTPASSAVTVLPAMPPDADHTGPGLDRSIVVPSPTCPEGFPPQQYGLPSASTQVWTAPAVMVVICLPASTPDVLTGVGAPRSMVVPSPSCPSLFSPQQYGVPSASTQVWSPPAATAVTVLPARTASTAMGRVRFVVVPSPSLPDVFSP